MLPIWEDRYPGEDKIGRVVDQVSQWAANPTPETAEAIREANRRVAGYTWWCCSVMGPKNQSNCPGDFAGDSIVWAAKAITEGDEGEQFRASAERSLNDAVEAIARQTAGAWFPDESTDYWSLAFGSLLGALLGKRAPRE
jgi:hypothetical protein